VAIVMDGNRRFATSHNLAKERGHAFGADKLMEAGAYTRSLFSST